MQTMRNARHSPRHHFHPVEHRSAPRYPAVENVSLVGWWRDQRLETTAAQVMDVSRSGLLILADDDPPGDGPVLVRLVKPTITAWVELSLVESKRTRFGPYQLRLAFREVPPLAFFAAATSRFGEGG